MIWLTLGPRRLRLRSCLVAEKVESHIVTESSQTTVVDGPRFLARLTAYPAGKADAIPLIH